MPVGPYKTFGECVGAQKKKGKGDESARAICGQIEKKTQQGLRNASSSVKYEDDNGHLYIKAFLLSSDVNINQWGVNPNSLDKRINTFIGKPLVLTETFNHPMPPEIHRRGAEEYDDDEDPYNTVNIHDIVDHWLAYQEAYRVGSIIDITEKKGTYFGIIEITDPAAKEAFRNNDLPLFVSPAIAQLDPYEDPSNITNWTGIHLAIVANPAFTIKKAIISGQCHDEKERCLLQLRQAAIEEKVIPRVGCGFCRYDALARYAEIVKSWRTKHSVVINQPKAKNLEEFTNSSIDFSGSHVKTELNNHDKDQTNNSSDTNNKQEFEKVQEEQGGQGAPQKGQVTKTTTDKTTETNKEEVTKSAAEEVAMKVAGMDECITIFQQNGIQDPRQAMQICKLAAQAFEQNNAGQNPQQSPQGGGGQQRGVPSSGQFGSVTEYEKELTKHQLKISELQEELKRYRKDDKTEAQRIAELEDTVTKLNRTLKEKEIESYLVTKIADEKFRNEKIKRFADLNLSLEDIKEIFEIAPKGNTGNIKKVASVEETPSPISRAKLRVASTQEEEDTKPTASNSIREKNNSIFSSLLSKGGFN